MPNRVEIRKDIDEHIYCLDMKGVIHYGQARFSLGDANGDLLSTIDRFYTKFKEILDEAKLIHRGVLVSSQVFEKLRVFFQE